MPTTPPPPPTAHTFLETRVRALQKHVDNLGLNTTRTESRNGSRFSVKRRTPASRFLVPVANTFFRLAGNPVKVIGDPDRWTGWEVHCFNRLHGARFHAFAENREVWAPILPGTSLSALLDSGALAPHHCAMAAAELRRAHAMESRDYRGPWSHGDPHLGNFIADPLDGVARLIDFEVFHTPLIAAPVRHADDLMVVLLDLCGRAPSDSWLPCARAFLDTYGSDRITAIIRARLQIPPAPARLWWAIRTSWMDTAELRRRLAQLRSSL